MKQFMSDTVLFFKSFTITFILLVGIMFLVGSCVGLHSRKPASDLEAEVIHPAIVRLHDVDTGKFFCSGTVISDKLVLTAAHCLHRDGYMGAYTLKTVGIRANDAVDRGLEAKVLNKNYRADYALLGGDFHKFDQMSVLSKPMDVVVNLVGRSDARIVACGYPWGGDLFCSPFMNRHMFRFEFAGLGFLYPGMSGGPVFDAEQGGILGVNSEVIDGEIAISPTIEIFRNLEIEE